MDNFGENKINLLEGSDESDHLGKFEAGIRETWGWNNFDSGEWTEKEILSKTWSFTQFEWGMEHLREITNNEWSKVLNMPKNKEGAYLEKVESEHLNMEVSLLMSYWLGYKMCGK